MAASTADVVNYWIQMFVSTFATISTFIGLVSFSMQIRKEHQSVKVYRCIHGTSYAAIVSAFIWYFLFFFGYIISPLVLKLYKEPHKDCSFSVSISIFFLLIYLHGMYLFYYSRLLIIFQDGVFALSSAVKTCILSCIIISFIISMSYPLLFIKGHTIELDLTSQTTIITCVLEVNVIDQIVALLGGISGITFTIVYAYMFVKRMKILCSHEIKSESSKSGGRAQKQMGAMVGIIEKYTVLTVVCCVSTCLFTVVYVVLFPIAAFSFLVSIDALINIFCVFLMFKFNDKYYQRFITCYPVGIGCLRIVRKIARIDSDDAGNKNNTTSIQIGVSSTEKSVENTDAKSVESEMYELDKGNNKSLFKCCKKTK